MLARFGLRSLFAFVTVCAFIAWWFSGQRVLLDTGRVFDLAIDGEGYFAVQMPNGEARLTRNGRFVLDEHNRMATSDGAILLNGGIPLDSRTVAIRRDGTIVVATKRGAIHEIGPILLCAWNDPGDLVVDPHAGNDYYMAKRYPADKCGGGGVDGLGVICQGCVETTIREWVVSRFRKD